MPDAWVTFLKPLPFTVTLNGRSWAIAEQPGMKSGLVAVIAVETSGSVANRKWYVLTSGREYDVNQDLRRGFKVSSGTPVRGLVSAMRRAGVAELRSAPRSSQR